MSAADALKGRGPSDGSILCQFAPYLIRALRAQDTAARYGGEEFLVVLDQASEAAWMSPSG